VTHDKTPPSTDMLTGVTAIASGTDDYACALMTTGGVRCWGSNQFGQLGDGTLQDRSTPAGTDVLTDVQSIATGYYYTCALMTTGGVRCWGDNGSGQLGNDPYTTPCPTSDVPVQCSPVPIEVQGLTSGVKAIAAGYAHTCALMTTGGVRCWGSNQWGQLGDDTSLGSYRSTPPSTDVLTGVEAIVTGAMHTCALMTTGGVRCWGENSSGQLGDGTTTYAETTPPTSDVLTGVQGVAAAGVKGYTVSGGHTCALMTTSGVRCWGSNQWGQLGDGTTTGRLTPPSSDLLTGVQAIAAAGVYNVQSTVAGGHTCALMMTGSVRCWGWNYFGQLGDGTTIDRSTPTPVQGICQ
jgi:alpha-tubulin suppressor-like RCC1 family protein